MSTVATITPQSKSTTTSSAASNQIAISGYVPVYRAILHDGLSLNAAVAYGLIASYQERFPDGTPSLQSLGEEVGFSRSTMGRAVQELERSGWIEKRRRGQGFTSLYILKEGDPWR